RPAGEEYEQVGGVGDRDVGQGVVRVGKARDVIDKNRDQRKATPEINGIGFARHTFVVPASEPGGEAGHDDDDGDLHGTLHADDPDISTHPAAQFFGVGRGL